MGNLAGRSAVPPASDGEDGDLFGPGDLGESGAKRSVGAGPEALRGGTVRLRSALRPSNRAILSAAYRRLSSASARLSLIRPLSPPFGSDLQQIQQSPFPINRIPEATSEEPPPPSTKRPSAQGLLPSWPPTSLRPGKPARVSFLSRLRFAAISSYLGSENGSLRGP